MPLEEFPAKEEGNPVVAATLTVTKAGDGLSSPLSLSPTAWVVGERVTIVLTGTVEKVTHAHVGKAEKEWLLLGNELDDGQVALVRGHVLAADGVAVVPDAKVKTVGGILAAAEKETSRLAAERQREMDRLASLQAEREAKELEEAAGIQHLAGTTGDEDIQEVDPDALDEGEEA